jgi:hypothetical protein
VDVTLADVDGDARLDIVAADGNAGRIVLMRNTGNSEFVPWAALDTPERLARAFAFDVDGNGSTDVLGISLFDYFEPQPGTLYVSRSNGEGGFLAREEYSTGIGTTDVHAHDLGSDGDLDLVIVNGGANSQWGTDPGGVDIRQVGPGGILQPPSSIPGIEHPRFVAVDDFDGDRQMDLAISHPFGVALVLTSAGRSSLEEAPGQCSLAAADLDGDGVTDIVCASAQSPLVLYRGFENGHFTGPESLPVVGDRNEGIVLEHDGFVLARDLDADGDVNLVTMRSIGRSIWVHRR